MSFHAGNIVCLILVMGTLYYSYRSATDARYIKRLLQRRSVQYHKIDIDNALLRRAILALADRDTAQFEFIERIFASRNATLRFVLEELPNSYDLLGGLEFPDIDDDKAFWADDRIRRFGLHENKNDAQT